MSNTNWDEILPNPKIQYDPSNALGSHGFFKCSVCGNAFYGFGEALHTSECTSKDYENCIYHYGDEEVFRITDYLNHFQIQGFHGCWIELAIIREKSLLPSNFNEQIQQYHQKLLEVKSPEKADFELELIKRFFDVKHSQQTITPLSRGGRI